MTSSQDDDRDDEWFKEVYGGEYTGPTNPRERKQDGNDLKKAASSKPSTNAVESDEEEQIRDPNAVPTDFTSREAKFWEAKAKAVERNWKRRKEEEFTCRICGETGHFTQGCPSTLGVNRKSSEVTETISVRDKQLKAHIIGTGGSVIQSLEKDTGCCLSLEDSHSGGNVAFTINVSGPNRTTVKKAVRFLNNFLDQLEGEPKHRPQGQKESLHVAPPANPIIAAQMQHIDELHQNSSLQFDSGRNEFSNLNDSRAGKERFLSYLDNHRMWDGGSSHAFDGRDASAVGNLSSSFNGKSSIVVMEDAGSYYHDQGQDRGLLHKSQDYLHDQERKQAIQARYDELNLPKILQELEGLFMFETRQLTMDQKDEEDKECARHHERMREIHGFYQQKLLSSRAKQMQGRGHLQNEQLNKLAPHQSGYSHRIPPLQSYSESPLVQQSRSYPELVYSLGNELHPGEDQHQDLLGYPYSRKRRGASQSYGKKQAYDSSSYHREESQQYPAFL